MPGTRINHVTWLLIHQLMRHAVLRLYYYTLITFMPIKAHLRCTVWEHRWQLLCDATSVMPATGDAFSQQAGDTVHSVG